MVNIFVPEKRKNREKTVKIRPNQVIFGRFRKKSSPLVDLTTSPSIEPTIEPWWMSELDPIKGCADNKRYPSPLNKHLSCSKFSGILMSRSITKSER